MSLFELDDDIPSESLRGKLQPGITLEGFVDVQVSVIFMDEEHYP